MTKREPVKFHRSEVRFIAEQEGEIEQEFKRKLIDFFEDHQSVTKAYLAVVDYGTPATFTVALCLRTSSGSEQSLVKSIGNVFSSIFSSAEHLDILFLDDDQEMRLMRVCRPFYQTTS